jgi:hypothetical protein
MRAIATWLRDRRLPLAAVVAVGCFAILAGRFWHPYYGFTKFLQFEQTVPGRAPVVREATAAPIFRYPPEHVYDGAMYVQLAFHPLLDSPELKPAIDNLSYRARRMLGGTLAWLAAGGRADRIAHTYAALNVVVWLVFAVVLWRLLPVTDARAFVAWAALLFSSGALFSVRLALTDLLSVTLLALALLLVERGRLRAGLAALATGSLARETVLLGVVGWWRGPWLAPRSWLRNALWSIAVAVPLGLWLIYVRSKSGEAEPGLGNFTLPVAGFLTKWSESVANLGRHPEFRWLMITTLLAVAGLTAQAVYIATRRQTDDPWWRIGIVSVALMLLLGQAVWEGHPGAATRVLLPLSLAFTVLAVRQRASLAWLVLGALPVCSGVTALWNVPHDATEIGAGRHEHGAYLVRLGDGWYGPERQGRNTWAWTANRGALDVESQHTVDTTNRLRVGVRAMTDRRVEIRQGDVVLWSGMAGKTLQTVDVAGVRLAGGRATLEFSSAAPPERESASADARGLGFAVYNVRLD